MCWECASHTLLGGGTICVESLRKAAIEARPYATWYSSCARCNIYISRLCYDASVRLSVTFVHCGHRVRWIPDTFARLDRWMSLLLTDNASPRSSDGMMPGFLVEEGGMEKLVVVAISLILLIFYRWTGNMWRLCLYERYGCLAFFYFSNLGRKCIISLERFVLELPTSRAMLATVRLLLVYDTVQ